MQKINFTGPGGPLNRYSTGEPDDTAAIARIEEAAGCLPQVDSSEGLRRAAKALRDSQRASRPVRAFAWSVFGEACRYAARFDDAERAHAIGFGLAGSNDWSQAEVAKRCAILRAEQGHKLAAEHLLDIWEAWASKGGKCGKALAFRSSVMALLGEFAAGAEAARQALEVLPTEGSRQHYVFSVMNLALCRLETISTHSDLIAAAEGIASARNMVLQGSQTAARLVWLECRLVSNLGDHEAAIGAFEDSWPLIEKKLNVLDQALYALDFAKAHLSAGATEEARSVAARSFALLKALRFHRDAFAAFSVFYRSAIAGNLDSVVLSTVRSQILAAR